MEVRNPTGVFVPRPRISRHHDANQNACRRAGAIAETPVAPRPYPVIVELPLDPAHQILDQLIARLTNSPDREAAARP